MDANEKIYNIDYKTNAYMFTLKDNSTENTENVSAEFMELSAVKGVVQNTTLYNQINTIVNSLNKIMIICKKKKKKKFNKKKKKKKKKFINFKKKRK